MDAYSIGVLVACVMLLCSAIFFLSRKVTDLRMEILDMQINLAKAEADNKHQYIFILDEMIEMNKILKQTLEGEKSESE